MMKIFLIYIVINLAIIILRLATLKRFRRNRAIVEVVHIYDEVAEWVPAPLFVVLFVVCCSLFAVPALIDKIFDNKSRGK